MSEKHHPFSPSTWDRVFNCIGSFILSEGLETPENEDSKRGDKLHKAINPENQIEVTNEEFIAIEKCRKYIKDILKQFDLKESDCDFYWENKIDLKDGKIKISDGTPDLVIVPKSKNFLIIIDWKFGYNKVNINTRQLKGYTINSCQAYKKDKSYCFVSQPFINHYDSIEYDFPLELLSEVRKYIRKIEIHKKRNIIQCVPGDHCQYCPAKFHDKCQAYKLQENKLVEINKNNLTTIEGDKLVELMEIGKDIAKKTKAIENEVKARIKANGECSGYELKEKQGNREISNISAAQKVTSNYIDKLDFLKICKVPYSKYRDTFIDSYVEENEGTKKAAGEKFDELLEDYITRGKSKLTLEKAK